MKSQQTSQYTWLQYKMTIKDWIMHLVVTPSLVMIINYWLIGSAYFSSAAVFISTSLILAIIAMVLSVTNMRSMFAIRRKFPHLNQTGKRLLTSFLLYFLFNISGGMLILLAYKSLPFLSFAITPDKVIKMTLLLLLAATIAGFSYEFFYSFGKWKESVIDNEKLQKQQALIELSVLKSQVSPHFLFNSLNCLSSLMTEDIERAEHYLNEMTKVYRYLLKSSEIELIALEKELQLIQSYFNLIKTRYGQGIEMNLSICSKHDNYLLPPLTLQLLVENAVKHNAILKQSPLVIEIITTEEGELIVRNNLQKKTSKIDSTKIGLTNIASKYKLLNQPDIQIHQTETAFTVILPLIPSEAVVLDERTLGIDG